MDTLGTAEVPTFKLAKVGKGKKERKRGGFGWLRGGRAGQGFRGAFGGSGAGAGAAGAAAASNTLLAIALVSGLSAGAMLFGRWMAARPSPSAPSAPKKAFADKGAQAYGDLSGVIKGDDKSMPNSLGYVSGSLDGLTDEERAKKAAEEEAARKAQEEADKKAQEEADRKAKEEADRQAEAAQAAGAAGNGAGGGLQSGKFGQLGSRFGGGGSPFGGGAGMSGGLGRGLGGSSGFGMTKGGKGSLSTLKRQSRASLASASNKGANAGKSKNFAKNQLLNTFARSRQAAASGTGETSATSASSPFDNNAGQGTVISGSGVGSGSTSGTADSVPNSTTNDGSGSGSTTNSCTAAALGCTSKQFVNANCQCQNTNTGGTENAAKYQWMIDTVMVLMIICMILSFLLWLKGTVLGSAVGFAIQCAMIIIGIVVLALGVMIADASGDNLMGGIIAVVGAYIAITAWGMKGVGTGEFVMPASLMIASAAGMYAAGSVDKSKMD